MENNYKFIYGYIDEERKVMPGKIGGVSEDYSESM